MWRSERVITDPAFAHLPRTVDALLAHLRVEKKLHQGFVSIDGVECWLKFAFKSHPFRLKTLLLVTGPWCPAERLVEFRNLARLREIGVGAPRPIVYAEERWCGVMLTHLLAIEKVPDAVDLEKVLAARELSEAQLADLLWAAGDMLGRMHAAGFLHRDFFPRNVLLSGPPSPAPRLYTIDCRKGSWSPITVYPKTYDIACFDLWAATHAPIAARTAFYSAYAAAAKPASLEKLLDDAEARRRSLFRRFSRKRAVHRQQLPALDAPRVDAEAVRRYERPGPRAGVAARSSHTHEEKRT